MESEESEIDIVHDAWISFIGMMNDMYNGKDLISEMIILLNLEKEEIRGAGMGSVDRQTVQNFQDQLRVAGKVNVIELMQDITTLHETMDDKFDEFAKQIESYKKQKQNTIELEETGTKINIEEITLKDIEDGQTDATINDLSKRENKVFDYYFRLLILRFVGNLKVLSRDFNDILESNFCGKKLIDDPDRYKLFYMDNFHDTDLFPGFTSINIDIFPTPESQPFNSLHKAIHISVEHLDELISYIYRQKLAGKAYALSIEKNKKIKNMNKKYGPGISTFFIDGDVKTVKFFVEQFKNEPKARERFETLLNSIIKFEPGAKIVHDYYMKLFNYIKNYGVSKTGFTFLDDETKESDTSQKSGTVYDSDLGETYAMTKTELNKIIRQSKRSEK